MVAKRFMIIYITYIAAAILFDGVSERMTILTRGIEMTLCSWKVSPGLITTHQLRSLMDNKEEQISPGGCKPVFAPDRYGRPLVQHWHQKIWCVRVFIN